MNRMWAMLLCSVLPLVGCVGPRLTQSAERHKVYVLGSVNCQVEVDYRPGLTLMQALSHAGFPHNDSIKFHVHWVDKSGTLIRRRTFSYSAIVKGKANDQEVHAGDIIYLYRNPFYVILDLIERVLQPVRSVFTPATAAAGAALGTTTTTTTTP